MIQNIDNKRDTGKHLLDKLSVGDVSGSFMCALGKENPCKEQCFTCSEDERCDSENLSDKCPMCKSDNLLDVDDNWTKCCDCGFSFVG